MLRLVRAFTEDEESLEIVVVEDGSSVVEESSGSTVGFPSLPIVTLYKASVPLYSQNRPRKGKGRPLTVGTPGTAGSEAVDKHPEHRGYRIVAIPLQRGKRNIQKGLALQSHRHRYE